MIRARTVFSSVILAVACILFLNLVKTAHAANDFCFSATLWQNAGVDPSTLTKTTVNGQDMYCGANPPGSQLPPNTYDPVDVSRQLGAPVKCSEGAHPATAADVILMKAAHIDSAVVGMCWNPTDQNVGQTDAQAKQYLRSILCTNSQFGGAGPDGTISGLDSKFAVCAAKFIQSAGSQMTGQVPLLNGGTAPLCLREGFRTVAQQNIYAQAYLRNPANGIACTKGAGCEHPRGIAIDINAANMTNDANYQKLWSIAPQFNLNFYLKGRDKVHFVPTSTTCSGGGTGPAGTLAPTNFDFPQYYNAPLSQSPATSLLNGLRGMLGMPQPALLQPQYAPPPQQYQNPSGAQTYYDANGQPYYYNSAGQAISATTGQPINPSQSSTQTSGSTNVNSTGLNSALPTLQNTNPGGNGAGQVLINPSDFNATSSGGSSAAGNGDINFINSLANSLAPAGSNGTNPATGSSSPAQLNQNLQNVQGTQSQNSNGTQALGNYQYPTVLPPEVTQTFGSSNTNTTGDLTYSSDPGSPFQQFLGRLKGVLLTFSSWLRPFGNRAQSQQIID